MKPDPDPRVRIRKKIHQNHEVQMIPDPDGVRIRESYQTEWECIWIRILESGFRKFYADPRFASGPYPMPEFLDADKNLKAY